MAFHVVVEVPNTQPWVSVQQAVHVGTSSSSNIPFSPTSLVGATVGRPSKASHERTDMDPMKMSKSGFFCPRSDVQIRERIQPFMQRLTPEDPIIHKDEMLFHEVGTAHYRRRLGTSRIASTTNHLYFCLKHTLFPHIFF